MSTYSKAPAQRGDDLVEIVVKVPRWQYWLLRRASERQKVHPSVYATHLLRIAIAMKTPARKQAAARLHTMVEVRKLWLLHRTCNDIAAALGISKDYARSLVNELALREQDTA